MSSKDRTRRSPAAPVREAAPDPRPVVERLYRELLGREPDAGEMAEATRRMAADGSGVDLAVALAASAEARYRLLTRGDLVEAGDPAATLSFGVEDVLRLIADRLTHGGALPLPVKRVLTAFDEVRGGRDLSQALAALAPEGGAPAAAAVPAGEPPLPLDTVAEIIQLQYRGCFERRAGPAEIDAWLGNYQRGQPLADMILSMAKSPEGRMVATRMSPEGVPPGVLVQVLFEVLSERGANAVEVDLYRNMIEQGTVGLNDLVPPFFVEALGRRIVNVAPAPPLTTQEAYLFGAGGVISSDRWEERRSDPDAAYQRSAVPSTFYAVAKGDQPIISIITSLYCGRKYLRHFLDNMVAQTIFADCELIIVDANSPEGEEGMIREYQAKWKNIKYIRTPDRIGIYEAWNVAARMAKGRYLTNANLDDCRRDDSFEIQAGILDTLPFVDVTYQDVLYSFKENLNFDEIAEYGLSTKFPVLSNYNIIEFNSPHNGPMWRRSLHDELGYFNENYRSAADFEFWVRCRIAGKTFFKSNEPHVAYYVNPQGLSTRVDTRGVAEGQSIGRQYYRTLISPNLTLARDEFLAVANAIQPFETEATVRYEIVQDALLALGAGYSGQASAGAVA